MEREYRYDNMKFLLIFLVVFGHFCEINGVDEAVYRVIYAFHMPAMIFISGRFAKKNTQRLLMSIVIPYFCFQTLYIYYDAWLFEREGEVILQYSKPYWLMWYLMSLFWFFLILPWFEMLSEKGKRTGIILGFIVAVLAGMDDGIGFRFSASRSLCFLPFFLLGVMDQNRENKEENWIVKGVWLAAAAGILSYYYRYLQMDKRMFYYTYPYSKMSVGGGTERIGLLLCGVICIMALKKCIPNRRIPVVSYIGRYTLPIYLFHGFIRKYAQRYEWFTYSQKKNLVLSIGITIIILAVFGNQFFNKLLTGGFFLKRKEKSGKTDDNFPNSGLS